MAARQYKTYIIAFTQEKEADNLCTILTTIYPSTKIINFKHEYKGILYLGNTKEFEISTNQNLYFVSFYLQFNIRLSTLYNKIGQRVWEQLVYFHTANIFRPHEDRSIETLKTKILNYIELTIHNKMHSIDILEEITKEQYFKKKSK